MIRYAEETGIQTKSAKDKLTSAKKAYSNKRLTKSMLRKEAACLFRYHEFLISKIAEARKINYLTI